MPCGCPVSVKFGQQQQQRWAFLSLVTLFFSLPLLFPATITKAASVYAAINKDSSWTYCTIHTHTKFVSQTYISVLIGVVVVLLLLHLAVCSCFTVSHRSNLTGNGEEKEKESSRGPSIQHMSMLQSYMSVRVQWNLNFSQYLIECVHRRTHKSIQMNVPLHLSRLSSFFSVHVLCVSLSFHLLCLFMSSFITGEVELKYQYIHATLIMIARQL